MLLPSTLPTIVMLHYVSDHPDHDALRPWNISRNSYIRLLDYIEQQNYTTIGFEDIVMPQYSKRKSIIITFDDCPKELWDFAIPELISRNMKAVFYIPTVHMGGYNEWNVLEGLPKVDLMDDEDIAKLSAVVMEIGSHAHNHIMLEEKKETEIIDQLTKSKSILEKIINKPVVSVAYPYGSVPPNAYKLAKDAGYRYGLAVFTPWQTKYTIRRWIYDDTDSIESIRHKMSVMYTWQRAVVDKWHFYSKKFLRKLYQNYSRLKNALRLHAVSLFFVEHVQYIVE